ncbi:MAG: MFS transporter, partial [Terriglobia bacterium]|nr:MFS transporter [Terriglobia bacterium]
MSGSSSIRTHSIGLTSGENADPLPDSSSSALVDRAVSRARKRLVPFLMLLYVVSFLDRANISFAKQALQTSVGISEGTYALAAGIFFIGYSLCGFPSNLFLHKIGAKIWISFLMVGWGLVSMATMFVRGSISFYLLRLLLGVMEAGFFPGAILYLTYWFPNRVRGRILGLFYLGVPLALIVGGPLSGLLLGMHPWGGLQNWQWMFLVEGLMAVLLGCWAFRYLDSRPSDAAWLPAQEKRSLVDALAAEEMGRRSAGPAKILPMLRDARVMQFLLIYTLIQMSTYGAIFYLPTEIS